MIGFLGDIHGNFRSLRDVFKRHPDVTYWFQVGDLGEPNKPYKYLPENFTFIQGNHENWDEIEKFRKKGDALFLPNGEVRKFGEITVASFGGNYSPKFFRKKRSSICGDRRRHFLEEEVEKLKGYDGKIDVLLTHEAPSPYRPKDLDIGQEVITDLIEAIQPKIHFFGHHHYYGQYGYKGVRSIGLDYGYKSFVMWDPETFETKWTY